MAKKGETYKQVPTLWHIGWGYPCRVMRKRRTWWDRKNPRALRWANCEHRVLTMATATRWKRLEAQGKAIVRRDVNLEAFIQAGIVPIPKRAEWAKAGQTAGAWQNDGH